jgi:4-hydroxy-tetrahydrodipicolinate synthase
MIEKEVIDMMDGFVPALGTPLDNNGNLVKDSLQKQIEDQIRAGAVGLLCMGSMGIQAFIRNDVYPQVVKAAVEAAAGRVPVYVGAMDTSIARAKERMAAVEDLDIAGFVFTAPYYSPASRDQMMRFFKGVAAATKHQVLLYDLPGVTQCKITYDMVLELIRNVPNMAGIKSADLQMFRKLKLNPEVPENFIMVYSGLDTFDIAYKWGITNCLDGMLSCTPANTKKMFAAMAEGDYGTAAECLNRIVALRDFFVSHDLWPSFTAAMNLLGYEGIYGPDYVAEVQPASVEEIRQEMNRIGELTLG